MTAYPKPEANSEYSKFQSLIEQERYVPLRTRYWDERGIEVKELLVQPESLEQHKAVWIPMHSTMRNLRQDSYTALRIEEIRTNVDLGRKFFDMRRLETH